MSLLVGINDPAIIEIAQKVYNTQFAQNPSLDKLYDDRQKQLFYQDILYNIGYLHTAIKLEDKNIFTTYAIWLYELLCSIMKNLDRNVIKDQMVEHYSLLISEAPSLFSGEAVQLSQLYLNAAIVATEIAVTNIPFSDRFLSGKHVAIRQTYIDALLRSKTHEAAKIIVDASSDIPLVEIFEDILEETMHEIGELWHRNQITIDKEHYCTSTTQMVLSQFYPVIFAQNRHNLTLLSCCVGSELHEMGGRMVSDLFEYNGWDSIYLGAAVPKASILAAVREHNPDLVSLSVTMPHYLIDCREIVDALREEFPSLKIAVGGGAFESTDHLWQKWPIDIYTRKASELTKWAQEQFLQEGKK